MPAFTCRRCLAAALIVVPGLAQATVISPPGGRVSVSFEPQTFSFSRFAAPEAGSPQETPVAFTVVGIERGVRIDAALGARSFFDFEEMSTAFAPFTFAAASGFAISGYEITLAGRYVIDGIGSVRMLGGPVAIGFSSDGPAGEVVSNSFNVATPSTASDASRLDLVFTASTGPQTAMPPNYAALLSVDSISVQARVSAVPEPSTASLMLAGLAALGAGVGAVRRRSGRARDACGGTLAPDQRSGHG